MPYKHKVNSVIQVGVKDAVGKPVRAVDLARDIVYGRGEKQYGHPYDDFGRTARLWSVILGVDVTREQVAMCQMMVKVSREMNMPQQDNRVDMIGYAEALDRVARRGQGDPSA